MEPKRRTPYNAKRRRSDAPDLKMLGSSHFKGVPDLSNIRSSKVSRISGKPDLLALKESKLTPPLSWTSAPFTNRPQDISRQRGVGPSAHAMSHLGPQAHIFPQQQQYNMQQALANNPALQQQELNALHQAFVRQQHHRPVFGGEAYSRSQFAMADDFAAWLFNDSIFGPSASPMGYPTGSGNMNNVMGGASSWIGPRQTLPALQNPNSPSWDGPNRSPNQGQKLPSFRQLGELAEAASNKQNKARADGYHPHRQSFSSTGQSPTLASRHFPISTQRSLLASYRKMENEAKQPRELTSHGLQDKEPRVSSVPKELETRNDFPVKTKLLKHHTISEDLTGGDGCIARKKLIALRDFSGDHCFKDPTYPAERVKTSPR